MRRTAAALVIALAGCAAPTQLTHVQVVPQAERVKVKNVLVMGLFRDPAARQAYEYDMVEALKKTGVQARPSLELFPIGKVPTREEVQELVEREGFDGAVIGRLVDARTSVRSSAVVVDPFYGWYGTAMPMAYAPALDTSTTVVVETRVFHTASGAAEFSASSQTIDPYSAKEISEAHAGLVVAALKQNGVV